MPDLTSAASLRTGLHYWPDRSVPPTVGAQFAQALSASGIDYFQTWDQLVSFFPRSLWREDTTPLAAISPDCDSFHDAFQLAAVASTGAPQLGLTVTTDAIRRGPAELLQSLYTLGSLTSGPIAVQIGAGELKQTRSFGYRRSEGLKRLEDMFRIIRELMKSDGLVSVQGNHWNYQDAWIGGSKPCTPLLWALGGGPQLISTAARHADGWVSLAPCVFPTADQYDAGVRNVKDQVAQAGRDAGSFTFGLWPVVLTYDDENDLEPILDNALMRWTAAIFGRLQQSDWEREGIVPVMPADWHYALKLVPHTMSAAEVDEIVKSVPREMVLKSFIHGTPETVAHQLRGYVDAGCNFIAPLDFSAAVLPLDQQQGVVERNIRICQILQAG